MKEPFGFLVFLLGLVLWIGLLGMLGRCTIDVSGNVGDYGVKYHYPTKN